MVVAAFIKTPPRQLLSVSYKEDLNRVILTCANCGNPFAEDDHDEIERWEA
jgi:hypothetical protein